MATLNERLQELRQEKQLSQTELASNVGLSLRAYQYYERGERQPSADTLICLANFFDVSLDYLCGRSNRREVKQLNSSDIALTPSFFQEILVGLTQRPAFL